MKFLILFSVCLVLHSVRTLYSVFKYKNRIDSSNRLVFATMFLVMVGLWITWFQMCETDAGTLNIPPLVQYLGLALFILGLLLFIIPLLQLRGLENIDRLVTNGIFALVRHPMYMGMIFWVIGYPLFLQAKFTLMTSGIWIANILVWRHLEEKELLETYADYASYKKSTLF